MQKLTLNAQNEVIDATEKSKNDLKTLAQNNQLSDNFMFENVANLDWEIITIHQKISMKTALNFHNYIKWGKIKDNLSVTPDLLLLAKYKGNINILLSKEPDFESFVRRHKDVLPWAYVDMKRFSNDFVEEIGDNIPWNSVFTVDREDEAFIRRNLYRATDLPNTWYHISYHQTVSEQFLRDFQDKIHFHFVVGMKDKHTLSDAFVEDFKYVLGQKSIIKNQKNNLSAAYLKEYKKFDIDNFYRNATEEWLKSQPTYCLDWLRVSEFTKLSDAFVLENLDKFHIYRLASNHHFSEDFVRKIIPKIKDKGDISYIFALQAFSQEFLAEFIEKIGLKYISGNQLLMDNLSEDFIRKYAKKWDFSLLASAKRFSEDFLKEFANKWDWDYQIPYSQRVSSEFLSEFSAKFSSIGWDRLSIYQDLSEDFIRKYAHKVEWNSISKFQTLSEGFIREFKDKINWALVSLNYEFSDTFKIEFADKLEQPHAGAFLNHFEYKAYEIIEQPLSTQQELEKAFVFIEKALFYKSKTVLANKPTFSNEVQRRILMALNRKEDAFALIKWALKTDKKFKQFQHFNTDKAYLEWLKNN